VSEPTPEISVVVPSHDRPLRLRWLLNALEEQTLAHDRFEVIVGHDSTRPETEELLRSHPLARAGVLRHLKLPSPSAPGRSRNAAWRSARTPLIAFTDDDCRPPAEWLERALASGRRHPGAIVQGATRPDPEEALIAIYAPWTRTQRVVPPQPWGQACNIVYPRSVLEACGGFPEDYWGGEDAALAETARVRGVPYVGAPEVLTYHAIEEGSLPAMARVSLRWQHLPLLLKRHPRLRDEFHLWLFYRREHLWLLVGAAGFALRRRSRLAMLLMVPYLARRFPAKYARDARGRLRATLEMPGHALLDAAEVAGLAYGSIRHRTLFL
jgi:glycosyltransferase involved in cell wall biosynthesis